MFLEFSRTTTTTKVSSIEFGALHQWNHPFFIGLSVSTPLFTYVKAYTTGDLLNQNLATVSQYTSLSGAVTWNNGNMIPTSMVLLPNLRKVQASLIISLQQNVRLASFSTLSFIGGSSTTVSLLCSYNNALTALLLPSLTYIGATQYTISISNNPLLALVSLTSLKYLPFTTAGSIFICSTNSAFSIPASLPPIWAGHQCNVHVNAASCPIAAFTACP